ncbi:zinc-binding protein A33-like [Labrus bergylta]|uniref:zinc-binding protein A33-like n=1 Tax=Labrus bergylta TaxID=56723 RepID=UPI0033140F2D
MTDTSLVSQSLGSILRGQSRKTNTSETGITKGSVSVEEQLSSCALCQCVLRDLVSTKCGHWFCRQCLTSYWDQSTSSGESSCPQCGERSKIRRGLQISTDRGLQEVTDELKISLRKRYEHVIEVMKQEVKPFSTRQKLNPTNRTKRQKINPTNRNTRQKLNPTNRNKRQKLNPTNRNKRQKLNPTNRNKRQKLNPTNRNTSEWF